MAILTHHCIIQHMQTLGLCRSATASLTAPLTVQDVQYGCCARHARSTYCTTKSSPCTWYTVGLQHYCTLLDYSHPRHRIMVLAAAGGLLSYCAICYAICKLHPQCKSSTPGLANAWSTGCWLAAAALAARLWWRWERNIVEAVQTCFRSSWVELKTIDSKSRNCFVFCPCRPTRCQARLYAYASNRGLSTIQCSNYILTPLVCFEAKPLLALLSIMHSPKYPLGQTVVAQPPRAEKTPSHGMHFIKICQPAHLRVR